VKDRVFPQYQDVSLEGFQINHPTQADAVATIRDYIGDLSRNRVQGVGLTIMGPNGTGKTHLACTVLKEVGMCRVFHFECIEADSYLNLCRQAFKGDSDDALHDHLRFIKSRADFVLLDDLGREEEFESGWSEQRLFNLTRYRFNRRKPTLVTTNLPLEQLTDRYTAGMVSFFMRANVNITVGGPDFCATAS